MNYITLLRNELLSISSENEKIKDKLTYFMQYLSSEKFQGEDSTGETKNWISATEVFNFLREVRNEIISSELAKTIKTQQPTEGEQVIQEIK